MTASVPVLLAGLVRIVDEGSQLDIAPLASFLTPGTCHTLLSDATGDKKMVSRLCAKVKALCDAYADGNDTMDVALVIRAGLCVHAVGIATRACHCGDEWVLETMGAAVPTLYSVGLLRNDPDHPLCIWAELLDELVYRVAERQAAGPPMLDRTTRRCRPREDNAVDRARVQQLRFAAHSRSSCRPSGQP